MADEVVNFRIGGGGNNQIIIDNGGTVTDGSFTGNLIETIRFNGISLKDLLDDYVENSQIFKDRVTEICKTYFNS